MDSPESKVLMLSADHGTGSATLSPSSPAFLHHQPDNSAGPGHSRETSTRSPVEVADLRHIGCNSGGSFPEAAWDLAVHSLLKHSSWRLGQFLKQLLFIA